MRLRVSGLLGVTLAASGFAQMKTVTLPSKSPLVNFRIVFTTGAMVAPADKPGLAHLTAAMLAGGGTKDLTYKQVVDAMFPMAAALNSQTDQEMTVFGGTTHVDNLPAYYKLAHAMLLEPDTELGREIGWSIVAQQPGPLLDGDLIEPGRMERQTQRLGDVRRGHRGAELPGQNVAREIIEYGR